MKENKFDVIIAGGNCAGISAALTLGRSVRKVLVIDNSAPCNMLTPFSHNFITHDGSWPEEIIAQGRKELLKYPTVSLLENTVADVSKTGSEFIVKVNTGEQFLTGKVLFSTGVKDIMFPISGFAECWGTSIFHCPYCHAYEHRGGTVAIMGNGDKGYEFAKTLCNWFDEMILCTNGPSGLDERQQSILRSHGVNVRENNISRIEQTDGQIEALIFEDNTRLTVNVLFATPDFVQHCDIPASLGCELTEDGLLVVDEAQKTTVPGIFAAGDNSRKTRAVSVAVAAGTVAGMCINQELTTESFEAFE